MFGFRKRNTSRKAVDDYTTSFMPQPDRLVEAVEPLVAVKPLAAVTPVEANFSSHMAQYIGKTVTIFVAGGGISGNGFTGVLLSANDIYIRLITRIGSPPACSLGNACNFKLRPCYSFRANLSIGSYKARYTLGSIAYIPVNKITSFVHDAL